MTTNSEFSLSKVCSLINQAGYPSVVEMTGGNCATLYVGKEDANGYHTTACGVGSYATDTAWYEEFFIGRDDDSGKGFYFHDYNNKFTEEQVAKAVIHAHQVYLSKTGA